MGLETYDDFLALGKNSLIDFLTMRGMSNKPELAARAFAAVDLNIPIEASTEEQNRMLANEYKKRISENGLTDPKKSWMRRSSMMIQNGSTLHLGYFLNIY